MGDSVDHDNSHFLAVQLDDDSNYFGAQVDVDFSDSSGAVLGDDSDFFAAQLDDDLDIIEEAAELPEVNLARDYTAFSKALCEALAAIKESDQSARGEREIDVQSITYSVYDAGRDTEGIFPEEFRKYIREQDLLCRRWGAHSTPDLLWVFRKKQYLNSPDIAFCDIINKTIRFFEISSPPVKFLVQFWKAQEVSDGFGQEHVQLTTQDQPFLLHGFSPEAFRLLGKADNICSYRMRKFANPASWGGDDGVIGRVFRNKRMEFTPYVGYYTSEEYPSRDLALSCNINGSLTLPLCDSSGHPLGVLEFVSPGDPSTSFTWNSLCHMLQRENPDYCKGLCGQYGTQDNFCLPVGELSQIMESVGKSCNLVFGQTWMLCKLCNSISTCENFDNSVSACYHHYGMGSSFLVAESAYILPKEQGIIGKAASLPHHLVYCQDIAKFSITEYPFAHFARGYNLSACLAVCLQSIYTGDQVYVLEFFLHSKYVEGRDLQAAVIPIIKAIKQNSRTFKLASGEELGGSLFVQVIDASSAEEIVTMENRGIDIGLLSGINNVVANRPYMSRGSIGGTSTEETDSIMEEATIVSFSTVESEFHMNVKAYYGCAFITFQLSKSSGIDALREQVSQLFKLENGTYIVKYQDDADDWILIECEEDVHEYISCSASLENYMMFIELKDSL